LGAYHTVPRRLIYLLSQLERSLLVSQPASFNSSVTTLRSQLGGNGAPEITSPKVGLYE